MNKIIKIILIIILFIPLSLGMFPFTLMINAILAGINYNLLIYRHRLDWGAESLLGSAAIWAVIMSALFCIFLIFYIIKTKK